MAFDAGLAQRIREHLQGRPGVTEKTMFGGIAFLLHGRMAVGISGDSMMARVGPERHAEALTGAHVRPMDFTGRPMKGYVFVDAPGLASDAALAAWI
ncbi:MAG: TfoX/Sxy family protein [Caldimonas sp.]